MGYFEPRNGKCLVTLMIAEKVDPDAPPKKAGPGAGLDALVGGAFAEICEAVWETTYRGAGCGGRDGDFEGEAANGGLKSPRFSYRLHSRGR
ncbi:MAG TPA: hypothetical protein VNZ53_59335 [Steroidobacteraceae bacterium]|nr:hypothetical protein [Steroidobacteraceae bacterium]